MSLTVFLFVIGFAFLLKGADLLVDGASAISKRFGVSSLVIGLTVVSFGTSAPELVVNIFSGFSGASDIGIGNVLGSNVANIFLILGIAGIISEMKMHHGLFYREIPFSLLAIVILGFVANDQILAGRSFNELDRIDGLVLLSVFSIFIYYLFSSGDGKHEKKPDIPDLSMPLALLYVLLGIAGLGFGGKWIVDGGIAIAESFDLSENFIGLTLVAIGTSLPELATTVVAAFKKQTDIAIGNVVGSNIFNIFFVLGITSVIDTIPFTPAVNNFDIFAVVVATVIFVGTVMIGKRATVERWNGVTFFMLYAAYMVFLIIRG